MRNKRKKYKKKLIIKYCCIGALYNVGSKLYDCHLMWSYVVGKSMSSRAII